MKSNKRAIFTLATGTLMIGGVLAAGLDAVTIQRTAMVGQKLTYDMSGNLSISGQDVDVTSKQVRTITAVGTDGSVSTDFLQTDLTVNGMPYGQDEPAVKTVAKPNGEFTSISAGEATATPARFLFLVAFYYPDKPVNVGDTWTVDVKPDAKLMAVPIHVELKLDGDEKIKDVDTWKVEGTIKETSGDAPSSASNTYWISKTDGSLVKQVEDFKDAPIGPGFGTGKFTIVKSG